MDRAFHIVDTTLREGEQSALGRFRPRDRLDMAVALEEFGIRHIELTSPVVSDGAARECRAISGALKKARVLAHIRCNAEDARRALEAGAHGLNLFIATSPKLRAASGLGSLDDVAARAVSVLEEIARISPGTPARLSFEDSFRTPPADILAFLSRLDGLASLKRVGLADTTGFATPMEVLNLVSLVRRSTSLDLEFHAHDDTGCAIANSFMALEAGASHISTSVLGLGERNGIASLAGMVARLQVSRPELLGDLRLGLLPGLHELAAARLGIEVPPNHYLVGSLAFNHKAGVHAAAVSKDPEAYEAISPELFALKRKVDVSSRLLGWRSVMLRAMELGYCLKAEKLKVISRSIKNRADVSAVQVGDIDSLIKEHYMQGAG